MLAVDQRKSVGLAGQRAVGQGRFLQEVLEPHLDQPGRLLRHEVNVVVAAHGHRAGVAQLLALVVLLVEIERPLARRLIVVVHRRRGPAVRAFVIDVESALILVGSAGGGRCRRTVVVGAGRENRRGECEKQ